MNNEEKSEVIISNDMALGKVFADSGMFPDVKSAAQGCVKIIAGRELGLSPIQSQNAFYILNNRVGMFAQTVAALIKKSKEYDYTIEEHNEEKCIITFYKNDEIVGRSDFDKAKAAKAGLINKDNYKNYPMNMYFAKAISNGAKWYCPEVICGFSTVEDLQEIEKIPVEKDVITITEKEEIKKNGKNT
jgi:hypothetical protein